MRDGKAAVPRRRFLNGFLGGTFAALGAAVLYPVARFLSPPHVAEAATNRVLAGKVPELAEKTWKIFPFGSEPGILVQTGPGEYRAFSGTCTHLSCTVQYEDDSKRIWCACHNGWYDLNGRNVAGPPPHPLERYEVNVVGEEIFVVRS
jgi:Rieske Fe-S protein